MLIPFGLLGKTQTPKSSEVSLSGRKHFLLCWFLLYEGGGGGGTIRPSVCHINQEICSSASEPAVAQASIRPTDSRPGPSTSSWRPLHIDAQHIEQTNHTPPFIPSPLRPRRLFEQRIDSHSRFKASLFLASRLHAYNLLLLHGDVVLAVQVYLLVCYSNVRPANQ